MPYNIKPLIAIPSPRDIPIVQQSLDSINRYDKLFVKYYPEYQAYPLIRSEFLGHKKKYTHLVISPDDLIADQLLLDRLFLDYLEYPVRDFIDRTCISGYCNVDTYTQRDFANVSQWRSSIEEKRKDRIYNFMTLQSLRNIWEKNVKARPKRSIISYLVPVLFSGFAFIVIPRLLIERIPFRNDSPTGNFDSSGCCVDVMFCRDALYKEGAQFFVDCRVELRHLKYCDGVPLEEVLNLPTKKNKDERIPHHFYQYATMNKT